MPLLPLLLLLLLLLHTSARAHLLVAVAHSVVPTAVTAAAIQTSKQQVSRCCWLCW